MSKPNNPGLFVVTAPAVPDVQLYAPAQPPMDAGTGIPHVCDNCPNVLDDCYPDTADRCSIKPK